MRGCDEALGCAGIREKISMGFFSQRVLFNMEGYQSVTVLLWLSPTPSSWFCALQGRKWLAINNRVITQLPVTQKSNWSYLSSVPFGTPLPNVFIQTSLWPWTYKSVLHKMLKTAGLRPGVAEEMQPMGTEGWAPAEFLVPGDSGVLQKPNLESKFWDFLPGAQSLLNEPTSD